jgi:hypothetical protein
VLNNNHYWPNNGVHAELEEVCLVVGCFRSACCASQRVIMQRHTDIAVRTARMLSAVMLVSATGCQSEAEIVGSSTLMWQPGTSCAE